MSRSTRYPTHYRIGVLNGKDIYYNPQEGLAVERDHSYLVEMTFGERCAVGASLLAEWENQRKDRASRIVHSERMRARSKAHSPITGNVSLGMEEW